VQSKEKLEKADSFKTLVLPSEDEGSMPFQGIDNYSFSNLHCGTALKTYIFINTTARTSYLTSFYQLAWCHIPEDMDLISCTDGYDKL
jgi:hypothetical protein